MDVSIIIVNHNTRQMVIDCIRSVIEQTKALNYELIIFDSCSTDGSVEAIRAEFPHIRLIASPENIGFAAANNIAAKQARGRKLLLLNPDTVILDHAIDRLHEFAETTPDCKIWGGRVVFADGSLNVSCRRDITLWSLVCLALGLSALFNPETYGNWKVDTVQPVDMVVGCFFLIDHDLWRSLGGFDPIFFMFGEETDLCIRARKLGAQPIITPKATIVHYGGASYPNKAGQIVQMLAGRVTLMHRHWPLIARFLGRWLYYAIPLTRSAIYGAGAFTTRKDSYRQKADMWAEVWNRRRRWIDGWNEAALLAARKTSPRAGCNPEFRGEGN
jgi:GT2 family glycosyltransferase